MSIGKEYVSNAVDSILRMDPTLDREDVKVFVKRIYKERLKSPTIILDNNVTGANKTIDLVSLCHFIRNENPVVSGNATFYCQPSVNRSPTSNMLRFLKKDRKAIKKEKFKYERGSMVYKKLELKEKRRKIVMNAEYGGSGTPKSAFYTKYSPAATTLMAQSIITTMAALFESYVGGNQKFFHIDECVDWMNRIIETKKDVEVDDWIYVPSAQEVIDRIIDHFHMMRDEDIPTIRSYVSNLSKHDLVFMYYTNNIRNLLLLHKHAQKPLRGIFTGLPCLEVAVDDNGIPESYRGKFKNRKEYNDHISSRMFMNPYNVPEEIQSHTSKLRSMIEKYCFVEYITPDSIMKLNNHKRNTVILVDTDSNVITIDTFVKLVTKEIFSNETFGREPFYNDMIAITTMAYILDTAVATLLDYYGRCHNMDEDARSELRMKNEFAFRLIFLMLKKKRYISLIASQEGNIRVPLVLDIKGMDFIKSGVSDIVMERFIKIIDDVIRMGELDLHKLMNDVHRFEKDIYDNLHSGNVEYLRLQKFKPETAYKKEYNAKGQLIKGPWQVQVYRGSMVWNELYPENKVNSVDTVKLVKLITTHEEDLDVIKETYPEEYALVKSKIFNSTNPEIKKAGLKIICLPQNLQQVPPWLIELVDYKTTISDIMSSFRSVLDSLEIENVSVKTPRGKAQLLSSLISI